MASIRRDIAIEAPAEKVWDAVRDVGGVHRRLALDFVTDTRLEPGARIVTFANGLVVRELIVDIDESQRRVAYSVVGGSPVHHHASMQVHAEGDRRSRLEWITDLLPDELAGSFATMIEQGAQAIKRTLDGNSVRATGARAPRS